VTEYGFALAGADTLKAHRDMLPSVLLELSIMRQTVREFGPAAGDDAKRLLERLAVLESKAWRLLGVRSSQSRHMSDH
jgi:hypothetical protein